MSEFQAAQALDKKDPLAEFRTHFVLTPNEIYLDGNSLGKLPKAAQKAVQDTVAKQWGERLIRSWNEAWLELPSRLAEKYAKLLQVSKEEVIIGESTSVRLYQVLHALAKSDLSPKHLGTDKLNFPTDLYVMEGIAQDFSFGEMTQIDYGQEIEADLEILKTTIKEKPGIYCLSLVSYKSSYLYPMKVLNLWAEQHRSILVWDLSHAVGAVTIDLKETATKIAVGCSYKYMNGGPGAPAFLFIQKALQRKLANPIQGWFGHKNPFAFESDYHPNQGIDRFASGTPPILSLQAMEAGVDLALKAGIKNIRKKSVLQSEFFLEGVREKLLPLGYQLESPTDPECRGSHVTLSHPASWKICQSLLQGTSKDSKIIPDFRPPHFIRFAITPLYTRFEELQKVIFRLESIVLTKEYQKFKTNKPRVT
ncbi:aminotransferase class V-fold PLP-dependent enzyme [Flavobacteriaceae bacterium]|jgi:kynureninase|nr:aminotransferase class V-fold PLP-dependent enzyme [Flavobacteriaceae bacterium]